MEFFFEVPNVQLDIATVQNQVTIQNLALLCASIYTVDVQNENKADIFCLWGNFKISRDKLKCGVRFSLLNCPHALTWSIALHENDTLMFHCTVDKTQLDAEFVESIQEFVDDWKKGLNNLIPQTL